jgi:hypothetical protein
MFDNQHTEQDLMFRSILENGQEEVPARVWDGVASGLDQIERRRTVVLWWRRTAVSVAAAAAVAIGVMLNRPSEEFVLPAQEDMVAVIAPQTIEEVTTPQTIEEVAEQTVYLAYAPAKAPAPVPVTVEQTVADATAENGQTDAQQQTTSAPKTEPAAKHVEPTADYYDWAEETPAAKNKVKASFVLSSTTGANSARKSSQSTRLRRPVNPNTLIKTGITEYGSSQYSLPLSFGIGVKIDLTDRWSVGTGVNYTMLSRQFTGEYLNVKDGSILEYTQSDIRNRQHYIGIPVNAYFNIISTDRIYFYTYAGGTVEKCVGNEYHILETSSLYKEKVQGVQWSANLGIGVEFMFGKHVGLYLDPSARYYFNNRQPKSIRTSQPFMVGFELGLRTRF